jgi:hypothetical protein
LFKAFCLKYDVPASLFQDWLAADVHLLAEYFALWLRKDMVLRATTIDQYFTHVANFYKESNVISSSTALRSPRLSLMLTAFEREDTAGCPARLLEKIPLIASLMVMAYALLRELYPDPLDPTAVCLACALSLGYALSLRPDEYLFKATHSVAADAHIALGHKSFFQWPDDPLFYCVTDPAAYPLHRGSPLFFLTLLDASKNDPHGHGAPRAIKAAPAGAAFCLVTSIFTCLRRYPPTASQPLLSGLPLRITDTAINMFLKTLAIRAGLDPARLVPHSARVAAIIQLSRHSQATQCRQGNWSTIPGMLAYARGSLEHAAMVCADMHDTALCTIDYLRLMCMTPTHGAFPPGLH